MREGDGRAAAGPSGWSPDGSFPPASAVPQALNFSPEKSDFMFSKSVTTDVALHEAQPPEATTPSEVREADSVDLCCPGLPPGDRGMSPVTPAPLLPAAPKGRGQDLPPLEETKAASPLFPTVEMARFQRVGDGKRGSREWVSGSSSVGPWQEGADELEGRRCPPQPLPTPGPSPALLPWVSKLSVTWDLSRAHLSSQDG